MSCFIDLIWLVGFSESSKVWFHDWGPCGISLQPFDFMQWCQCPHRAWTNRPTHPPVGHMQPQLTQAKRWPIFLSHLSHFSHTHEKHHRPETKHSSWKMMLWMITFIWDNNMFKEVYVKFQYCTIHVAWKLNISIKRGKHPFRGTSFFQATLSSSKRRLVTGIYTLLETNKRTTPFGTVEKMIFLFPKVGYGFVPWRVQFMWHVRPGEAFNTHFF